MDHEKMIAELKAGKKPIDLSIQKWIDVRDGVGEHHGGRNCACCHTTKNPKTCIGCAIHEYESTVRQFTPYSSMCGGMEIEYSKQYIAFMRKVRRWMIKEGTY